jgi:signal peptidase I
MDESHHIEDNRAYVIKDILGVIAFITAVVVGALLINTFLFRSYNVTGPSMEETLYTDDRLIVNRLPITFSRITGNEWLPGRGEIVVLKNPLYMPGQPDKYLVKRVIGLPGETVTVRDGKVTVFNQENPGGFNPDAALKGPQYPTSGAVDIEVPPGNVFVMGDNRTGNSSFDSRSGLGTIPLKNLQGPVLLRIYPFDQIRFF